MACIGSSTAIKPSTFKNNSEDGTRIHSSECMKILGFYFDERPTVDKHLFETGRKFKKRLWFLRHLAKAIKCKSELIDSYCVFLRPILEYCSNVFHPMLNATQTNMLERLQLSALKIVYGYNHNSHDLLKMSGLPSLQERRGTLFNNFCKKLHSNPRFRERWLEERNFTDHNLGQQKIIHEHFSRTERLYNSPLFAIRRNLNDLLVS